MKEIYMQNNINSAIEKYITSWCSFDRNNAAKEFKEEVIKEIDRIYDYVSKYNVDWGTETIMTIQQKLDKDIRDKYPFLNNKAIEILKNHFAYEWK